MLTGDFTHCGLAAGLAGSMSAVGIFRQLASISSLIATARLKLGALVKERVLLVH